MDTILGQYITTRSSILQAITLRLPNEKKKTLPNTLALTTNYTANEKQKIQNARTFKQIIYTYTNISYFSHCESFISKHVAHFMPLNPSHT